MKTAKFQISILIFLIGILIFLPSCSKNYPGSNGLYIPSVNDTTATASLEELLNGRELYISSCGACHAYVLPENLSKSQWQTALNRMTPYTRLSSSEIELVRKYVTKGK